MGEVPGFGPIAEPTRDSRQTGRLPRSNVYGGAVTARVVGLLLALCFAVGAVYRRNVLYFAVSTILLGWAGYRIQFVLHDTAHRSLFRRSRTNDAVGAFAGLLVGVNLTRYRATHLAHHRKNGLTGDPQLPDYLGDSHVTKASFVRFILAPLIAGRLIPYLRREVGKGQGSSETRVASTPVLWWLSLAVVQILLLTAVTRFWRFPELAVAYYGGLATVALFLARLRTLAEHQQVGSSRSDFSRTHTFSFLDWLLLYDANFNYHQEHHLSPGLQSRHLKRVFETTTRPLHDGESLGSSMVSTLWKTYKKLE